MKDYEVTVTGAPGDCDTLEDLLDYFAGTLDWGPVLIEDARPRLVVTVCATSAVAALSQVLLRLPTTLGGDVELRASEDAP